MKYLTITPWAAALTALLLLQGCTSVAPYQRGNLSKPEMGWTPDHQDATLQKHIYFAKEASSGGAEAAGGGCGCN
jgi:outer membrane biogenesis lipoprotein LolB